MVSAVVLGGIDGVISTASIMAACWVSATSLRVTVAIIISSILADAVSMGVSNFIASDDRKQKRDAFAQYMANGVSSRDARWFVKQLHILRAWM